MKRIGTLIAALPILAVFGAAFGQESMGLQRALDRQVDLTISDQPIGEVFSQLTTKTGVKFIIDDDTLECLPYGEQTRLTVTLRNITLRKALTPMLAPQALQWEIEGGSVHIVPSDPLFRLGKRATYEELKSLGAIMAAKLAPTREGDTVIEQLRKVSGNKDLDFKFKVQVDKGAMAQADKALPCSGADWLDTLCRGKDWTWYLEGDSIFVMDKVKQIERQLDRQVTLRYQNWRLASVLLDLAHKVRVKLTIDPGLLNSLPIESQNNCSLMMRATIGQALEVISGSTGLVFERTPEGIHVTASSSAGVAPQPATQPTAQKRAPFFVRMQMPGPDGTTIEVYLRSDELPPDMVQAIQAEKARMIEKARQEWKERGLLPATMPATVPDAGAED